MKKALTVFSIIVGITSCVFAQTNTFPSSGNVGIGTTNPDQKLDVSGNIRSAGWIGAGGHPISTYGGTSGFGIRLPSTTNDFIQIIGEHDGIDGSNGVFHTGDNVDDGWIFRQTDCCGAGTLDYAKIARDRFYYIGGNVGIGTSNPSQKLHLFNSSSSTFLNIDKPNSGVEGGILFSNNGAPMFYIWSDNTDDDALKIEVSGLPGEHDGAPRMMFPKTNTNIYMAQSGGNVGIGTTAPGPYKLAVEGTIGARKVKVTQVNPWADYVFNDDYLLLPLNKLEKYIQQNKHLPEVPSAAEVEKNGLDLGDNQAVLLKKIEELTLYVIDLKKENEKMNERIEQQQKEIQTLKNNQNKK